jgi:hypothetical protein
VYQLPFGVHNAGAAVALVTLLEDRLGAAYLGLVGLDDPALRAFGARAVRAAALHAATWRRSTLAFPGLDVPVPRAPEPASQGTGSPAPSGQAHGKPTPSHPG